MTMHGGKGATSSFPVAVKSLTESTHANLVAFLQEAAIMAQFSHENVVGLIGVVTTSPPMLIVLEFMSKGSLHKQLRAHQLDAASKLRAAADIANGMVYLSSKRYSGFFP